MENSNTTKTNEWKAVIISAALSAIVTLLLCTSIINTRNISISKSKIEEQQTTIETLKAENESLKKQIEDYEETVNEARVLSDQINQQINDVQTLIDQLSE